MLFLCYVHIFFFFIYSLFRVISSIVNFLEHRNVKLFISHGGLSGLYESLDAEVPVLGLPLFYDQPRNIQNLIDLGMALSLDINSITATKISSVINRLLNNQRYVIILLH